MNTSIFKNFNNSQTKYLFRFYQIFNDNLIEKNIILDKNLYCSFCNSKELKKHLEAYKPTAAIPLKCLPFVFYL